MRERGDHLVAAERPLNGPVAGLSALRHATASASGHSSNGRQTVRVTSVRGIPVLLRGKVSGYDLVIAPEGSILFHSGIASDDCLDRAVPKEPPNRVQLAGALAQNQETGQVAE